VPGGEEGVVREDKLIPGGAFGPTNPSPPPVTVEPPSALEICKTNDTINGTFVWVHGTHVNVTNITECLEIIKKLRELAKKPPSVLLMLADGTTPYPAGEKAGQSESALNGAYELAYVEHRPRISAFSPYPLVKYADYNQITLNRFGKLPFLGSPYPAYGSYEPVYIYRPVYPTASRAYDVYYYLPADHTQQQSNAEIQSPEAIADDEDSTDLLQEPMFKPKKEDANTEKEDYNSKKEETSVEAEGVREEVKAGMEEAEKEDASEIAMPNAVDELDRQQQALLEALSSEIEAELQAPRLDSQPVAGEMTRTEGAVVQDDEYWEKISNKDLISAVEIVLQQLNNRLSD
jgi:hypothetical protein